MKARKWLAAGAAVVLVAACGPGRRPDPPPAAASTPAPADTAAGTRTVDLDGRPFLLHVPASYSASAKAPLVILLHGYQASGQMQESYFKLAAEADRRGFLYALPDGTKNKQDKRFWNATEACCDFARSGVDDSAYLSKLIDTVKASHSVDAARVYLVGHSNGGFMAYRMACEHAAQITAVVSLAGAATADPGSCKPTRPVSVLQIHGTADRTIAFDGGANFGQRYPSVADTLAQWRRHDGCSGDADTSATPKDLDTGLAGAETTVTAYAAGCRGGSRVELWSIKQGEHIPRLSPGFAPAVLDFLLARVSP